MLVSVLTGFITPLGNTPFTYSINMILSNAQEYVKEHQMIGWAQSPFTIIIAFETIFLALFFDYFDLSSENFLNAFYYLVVDIVYIHIH